MTPLTRQEEVVRGLLLEERLSFESHHVFELRPPTPLRGLSVDFLVFLGAGVVLECTRCEKRRGGGASEAVRRAAFMNYRFQLIKRSFPRIMCGAVIEAPNEEEKKLQDLIADPLTRADFVSVSMDALRGALRGLVGA
jgi:hypothetical protein